MAKLNLLEIENGKDNLEVKEQDLTQYDVDFDFSTQNLTYDLRSEKDDHSAYFISRELVNAVNAAIVTGRPLLLKGEPGCGKTKLAKAVAAYFHDKEDAHKYYFEWFVKSKSTARGGCYNFDHVRRLRDATSGKDDTKASDSVDKTENYLKLGPLGYALRAAPDEDKPTVLLIDEIDKGDIDFPNDLLLELDEMRFAVSEKPGYYVSARAGQRPLVFITSNDERELPPAFLRRCLYYRIPPFDDQLLISIATKKRDSLYKKLGIDKAKEKYQKGDIEKIVQRFQKIKDGSMSTKPPSTSELLDWLKLITYHLHFSDRSIDELIDDTDLHKMALKIL